MPTPDFEEAIDRYHEAAADFIKGKPELYLAVFSHQDDTTIANPFGPPARGWALAEETMRRACKLWSEGEILGFDRISTNVTSELAYVLEMERFTGRMGGSAEAAPITLRVTSVLRPEDGTWKVVHRHADPIAAARSAESVIQT